MGQPSASPEPDPPPDTETAPDRAILIVDDSRLQRRIIAAQLIKRGLKIIEAASVDEALAMMEEVDIRMILSDWVMPGRDGLDLCRAIRGRTDGDAIYFILLTSKSGGTEIAEGLGAGADDFVSKPVNGEELVARITAGQRMIDMQDALRAGNAHRDAALAELRALGAAVERDLEESRRLQQSLMPERHVRIGRATLDLMLETSGQVGGDLVGFFPTSRGHLGFYGIDVSGHGITSALMTARLKGFLSTSEHTENVAVMRVADDVRFGRPPAQVAQRLNDLTHSEMQTEHYFTLLYADLDMETGRILFTQAGHPPPLVIRSDGGMEFVGGGGLPVGLVEEASYEQEEVVLHPGDRMLVYSDGMTECESPGGEMLEEDGLVGIVRELAGLDGALFLNGLRERLGQFAGANGFDDDVSAVLLTLDA